VSTFNTLAVIATALAAALLGLMSGYAIAARQRSRLRHALRLAAHAAHHDKLTGLPNRETLTRQLANPGSRTLVLAIVNLDRFAAINRLWGHRVGDQLLVLQAHRARYQARHDGVCYRLRRDEFAVVWPATADHAAQLADQLLAALAEPVELYVHDHPVTVTVCATAGVTTGAGTSSAGLLLARADTALQHAKQTARGTALLWRPSLAALPRPDRQPAHPAEGGQ